MGKQEIWRSERERDREWIRKRQYNIDKKSIWIFNDDLKSNQININ